MNGRAQPQGLRESVLFRERYAGPGTRSSRRPITAKDVGDREIHENLGPRERMVQRLGQGQRRAASFNRPLRKAEIPHRPAQIGQTGGARVLSVLESERAVLVDVVEWNGSLNVAAGRRKSPMNTKEPPSAKHASSITPSSRSVLRQAHALLAQAVGCCVIRADEVVAPGSPKRPKVLQGITRPRTQLESARIGSTGFRRALASHRHQSGAKRDPQGQLLSSTFGRIWQRFDQLKSFA